jgi:hypothetical protein
MGCEATGQTVSSCSPPPHDQKSNDVPETSAHRTIAIPIRSLERKQTAPLKFGNMSRILLIM